MTNSKTASPEPPGTVLTTAQTEQLHVLATSLSQEQAIWASGYLAGLGRMATTGLPGSESGLVPGLPANDQATTAPAIRLTTILYGSETGNGRDVATALAEAARNRGIDSKIADLGDYRMRDLKDEQDLLIITSTHGEGDPPQTALDFFEFLESRKAPKLPHLRFAVLALGDSTYEHYCSAGLRVDQRLVELGGERIAERVDCDVDYEDDAEAWMAAIVEALASARTSEASPEYSLSASVATINGQPSPTRFDKKNPFEAAVIENIVLTGRGSTKETRHIELSLEGSSLEYRPGDVLGVVPRNDPGLVSTLLEQLSIPAETATTVKKETMSLQDALTSRLEITAATPRFLEHWAGISGSTNLKALCSSGQARERIAFLATNHVLDIVASYPATGITPEQFTAGLRALPPRLYSIASSLEAAPGEAHLTVSTVSYQLKDIARLGVASGHLAGLTDEAATVPVYVQSNDHFHLPDDDTPILMIGAGTGVAPYRAFMQEREGRGVTGKSWMFFGERNFRSDFLYQVEWQDLFRNGVLDQFDLAFSRDSPEKFYVQDRLRSRGREVYAWLEDGACVYVCGDGTRMAPDVHAAFVDLVAEHGGLDRDGAEAYMTDLRRDHRYRLDVY